MRWHERFGRAHPITLPNEDAGLLTTDYLRPVRLQLELLKPRGKGAGYIIVVMGKCIRPLFQSDPPLSPDLRAIEPGQFA
jgi:hypothetical protein